MAEPMTATEAEGIARYLAKHAPPVGDGSISDRQTQVVVTLLAEVDRLRAALAQRDTTIAAARAKCEEVAHRGFDSAGLREVEAALSAPVEAGTPAAENDGGS